MGTKKQAVPPAPPAQIIVEEEDLAQLDVWVNFFQKLSLRVRLIRPGESEFNGFLERAEGKLREKRVIEPSSQLVGWPREEQVAFALLINSARPGAAAPVYADDDIYFFCFGDLAFSPNYFGWDGDAENDNWSNSFSLGRYSEELISWDFIKSRIIDKLKDLEKQIPKLQTKTR